MSKPEISSRRVTSVVLRYGLAVVSVAVALGLALLAQVYAIHNLEFPLFLIGHRRNGLVCGDRTWCPGGCYFQALSFNYFFTEPLYSFYIASF